MRFFASRAAITLFLLLYTGIPLTMAEPTPAAADGERFDAGAFEWAYGQVIDSITVSGNKKTDSIALLREMETRVGHRLDRIKLERDQHYLSDLSSVATVDIQVIPLEPGHCALELAVTERPTLLLKLLYPVLEYDFNTERLKYGFKLNDRNFRGQLENFSIDATRNTDGEDNASVGWSTRWLGWQHIGMNARASYFRRKNASVNLSILEQANLQAGLALPLTESRISFSQVIGSLAIRRNRVGRANESSQDEVLLAPLVGYRFDSRDSPLKPQRGEYFAVFAQHSRVINGEGSTYYSLFNDIRFFRPVGDVSVVAVQSNLAYQFGKYPDYLRFGMGGAGTVRGYSSGEFSGAHRWIQALEWRLAPFPERLFHIPFLGVVDVTVTWAFFLDTGIVWDNDENFRAGRFHGGGGCGLRIYSPIQDVVRLDYGINARGVAHVYFGTGIRF